MGYYEEQQAQEKAFHAKARAFAREVRDLAADAVEGATGVRHETHDTAYHIRFEVEGLRFQVVFPDYGKLNAASISLRCDSGQRGKIDLHGSPKTRTARAIEAVRKYIAASLAERARFQASLEKRRAKEEQPAPSVDRRVTRLTLSERTAGTVPRENVMNQGFDHFHFARCLIGSPNFESQDVEVAIHEASNALTDNQIVQLRLELEASLRGYAVIEYAERHGMGICKYADPVEDAREGLTPDEARAVANVDPSLLCLRFEPVSKPA